MDSRLRSGQLSRAVLPTLLGLVLLAAPDVRAEPYLMVRAGAKCGDCHTNLTGGGKRTPFAHIHAHDILKDVDLLGIPPGVKAFSGELHRNVAIGGDLRVRNTTVFQDRPVSGRVDNNTALRRQTLSNDSDVNEFLLYLQVDLLPDLVTLYVDENFDGGATNREAFGLVRGLPWDGYMKAGRFFPPFGLRVFDDDAFIRARSGFTFQNPDEGVELGAAPGPFSVAASVTNSDAGDKDVQATVNGYGVFEVPVVETVVAGASFARQSDKRYVAGLYGGSNLWRFSYLGEVDLIDDRTFASRNRRDRLAAYAELNFLVLEWLNLRGTFDFVHVSRDRDQTRWAFGAEPFISRVLQPRIQYRIANGARDRPQDNQDQLLFELHLFF